MHVVLSLQIAPVSWVDLDAGAVERRAENAARFVEQIVESLGSQHGIDVARNRRLDFFEIVIGQRVADRAVRWRRWEPWRRVECVQTPQLVYTRTGYFG